MDFPIFPMATVSRGQAGPGAEGWMRASRSIKEAQFGSSRGRQVGHVLEPRVKFRLSS